MQKDFKANQQVTTIEVLNAIDEKILQLLGARFQYVAEITKFKTDSVDVADAQRVAENIKNRRQWGMFEELIPDFVEEVFVSVHDYFIEEQQKLFAALQISEEEFENAIVELQAGIKDEYRPQNGEIFVAGLKLIAPKLCENKLAVRDILDALDLKLVQTLAERERCIEGLQESRRFALSQPVSHEIWAKETGLSLKVVENLFNILNKEQAPEISTDYMYKITLKPGTLDAFKGYMHQLAVLMDETYNVIVGETTHAEAFFVDGDNVYFAKSVLDLEKAREFKEGSDSPVYDVVQAMFGECVESMTSLNSIFSLNQKALPYNNRSYG